MTLFALRLRLPCQNSKFERVKKTTYNVRKQIKNNTLKVTITVDRLRIGGNDVVIVYCVLKIKVETFRIHVQSRTRTENESNRYDVEKEKTVRNRVYLNVKNTSTLH